MVGKSLSSSIVGIEAEIIQIEVDSMPSQLPGFTIGGLPDKAVQEAKERIVSAIKNSGFEWPRKKIVVNLAPADIPKTGTSFDLPIALAVLATSEQVDFNPEEFLFAGELALDGSLRNVNGALSTALECKKRNIKTFVLPLENSFEAGLVTGVDSIGIKSLEEAVSYLKGSKTLSPIKTEFGNNVSDGICEIDMKSIRGQQSVKRAAVIAAGGGHNLLLSGTPGSGKTMISRALPSILPNLTFDEALEITKVYSVANLLNNKQGIISTRPFRSPHHTASTTSIIGGGKFPKPGELSLAHRGVLFLDEFPEFSSFTLDALRQPLEDKKVVISRISGTLTFPANFMLVAAMNPCKCGWKGDPERECTCTPIVIDKYRKKISGPVMDRIDLQIVVPRVKVEDLAKYDQSKDLSSEEMKAIVQKCRDLQLSRFNGQKLFCNAEIPQRSITEFCPLSSEAHSFLVSAAQKLNLSARSYFRIIKVGRTIADLGESDIITKEHIAESIQYRINE